MADANGVVHCVSPIYDMWIDMPAADIALTRPLYAKCSMA
jgi:hypothetical protein